MGLLLVEPESCLCRDPSLDEILRDYDVQEERLVEGRGVIPCQSTMPHIPSPAAFNTRLAGGKAAHERDICASQHFTSLSRTIDVGAFNNDDSHVPHVCLPLSVFWSMLASGLTAASLANLILQYSGGRQGKQTCVTVCV